MATKDSKPAAASAATFQPVQTITYTEFVSQAADGLLEVFNAQQDQALKIAQAVAEALPKADELKLPVVETPGVDVPSAREVVEAGFKFADKYLANQKAYAEKFLALAGV